ncbi:MAG: hypothetical protein HQ522_17050, partial [Bacteroidetes bacterium]|nr:hypothetical protein [Bacteroidota bacterium]
MNQYTSYFTFLALFLVSFYNGIGQTNHWETVFYSDTNFSYFTSTEGTPASDWRITGFNDSAWRTGKGGIGYDDNDDNTTIEKCISVCLRTSFQLSEIDKITEAVLNIDYDDAFVAYLNGVEIARSAGLTGNFPEATQISSSNHEAKIYSGGLPESFFISKVKLSA